MFGSRTEMKRPSTEPNVQRGRQKHNKIQTSNAKNKRPSPTPTPLPSIHKAKIKMSNAKTKTTNAQAKRPTSKVQSQTSNAKDGGWANAKNGGWKTSPAEKKRLSEVQSQTSASKAHCHAHADIAFIAFMDFMTFSIVKEGQNTQSHLLTHPNSNNKNKWDSGLCKNWKSQTTHVSEFDWKFNHTTKQPIIAHWM